MKTISPEQVKGARRMLGWTQAQLAEFAHVSKSTIAQFESGGRQPSGWVVLAIQQVLEEQGFEFEAGRTAVTLRKDKAAL